MSIFQTYKSKCFYLNFIIFLALYGVFPHVTQAASEQDVRSLEQQDRDTWSHHDSTTAPTSNEQTAPPGTPSKQTLATSADDSIMTNGEKITPIEAEEFKVKAMKKSRSGRVILFEDATNNEPRPGKILLMKNATEEVIAVRVLKNYPSKFAAKTVLKFENKDAVIGQEYRALKKIADKIMERIREEMRKHPDSHLTDEELAKEIDPDDVELDRGIPASTKKGSKKKAMGDDLDPASLELKEDDLSDVPVDFSKQEDALLEPHNHALSAMLGLMSGVTIKNESTRYTGFGLKYAYNIARKLFLKKPTLQDMLTIEPGVFYYTISGYEKTDDEATVTPLLLTLRYNILFSENIMFYAYGGILKDMAFASKGQISTGLNNLKLTHPALGGGVMVKLGPGWALRADIGLELLAFGAVLKF